jgi:hypothetical protein
MSNPSAWITKESLRRLKAGGNESRGTIPVHCTPTRVAKIPVYLNPTDTVSENTNLMTMDIELDPDIKEYLQTVANLSGTTLEQATSVAFVLALIWDV